MSKPDWVTQLLRTEITDRILNDPRTVPGTWLGWPKKDVFWQVIEGGQAIFEQPIGHLCGADRALLYAMYNQPRHLDELFSAFTQLLATSTRFNRPTVIDIGCGPFTAGLALAAAIGAKRSFRYFGVDRAVPMLELGRRLFIAGRECGGINPMSRSWFGSNLADADFGQITGDLTIVAISYLFASATLDVDALSADLNSALDRTGLGPVAILYTNSAKPDLNAKFPDFQALLEAKRFTLILDKTEDFEDTKNPKPMRYALFFRKAITTLAL
jgi:SAM-dependent methyltransferase